MRSKKQKWTEAEWIAFGNRLKRVKREITNMLCEGSRVMNRSECNCLYKLDNKMIECQSKLENAAAPYVREELITRVFYGDPLELPK